MKNNINLSKEELSYFKNDIKSCNKYQKRKEKAPMKNFIKLLTAMAILILAYTAVCFYLAGNTKSPAEPLEFCPTNASAHSMVLKQWKHASQYTTFDYEKGV